MIKYHGPRPVPRAGRVWVANHSSMIDYIVLCSYSPFAGACLPALPCPASVQYMCEYACKHTAPKSR